jgi:ABC-2 type transport system permease protein
MSTRLTLATASRVLAQLRNDHRSVALMLVAPLVLLTLLRYVFDDAPQVFDRVGGPLLALFPFVTMFLVTSVAMLRERSSGTLERLLAMPLGKGDLLGGYALAFGSVAVVRRCSASALCLGPLGLDVAGSPAARGLLAVLDALLGTALGLLLSAFARTEFQAVQFLPAVILPQLLLCGLFAPREAMAAPLRWLSDVFPLTYAVDGMQRVVATADVTGAGDRPRRRGRLRRGLPRARLRHPPAPLRVTAPRRTGRRPGDSGAREAILREARQSFGSAGFSGTTIRGVARRPASTRRWCTTTSGARTSCSPRRSSCPSTRRSSCRRCSPRAWTGWGSGWCARSSASGTPPRAGAAARAAAQRRVGRARRAVAARLHHRRRPRAAGPRRRAGRRRARASLALAGAGLAMARYVVRLEPLASASATSSRRSSADARPLPAGTALGQSWRPPRAVNITVSNTSHHLTRVRATSLGV